MLTTKGHELSDDDEQIESVTEINIEFKKLSSLEDNIYITETEEKVYKELAVIEENEKEIIYKVMNKNTKTLYRKVVLKIIKDKTGFDE
ncbi:hypothetical protein M9Y10_018585 [Tritrichomonas musculus]|uniref:Uncharacterized protein n=1 Tax=Tritrichomonas musculus TaxID=1915356 RepID=A0ABR2HMS3_9EUKA